MKYDRLTKEDLAELLESKRLLLMQMAGARSRTRRFNEGFYKFLGEHARCRNHIGRTVERNRMNEQLGMIENSWRSHGYELDTIGVRRFTERDPQSGAAREVVLGSGKPCRKCRFLRSILEQETQYEVNVTPGDMAEVTLVPWGQKLATVIRGGKKRHVLVDKGMEVVSQ